MTDPSKRPRLDPKIWQKVLEEERQHIEEEAKLRKPGEPCVISQVEMMDWEDYEDRKRQEAV